MEFNSRKHRELIFKINSLWDNLRDLSEMAKEHGIEDIFQDNGAKTLQQLIYLNMEFLPGREGNDCISESGTEWEMKSINLNTSASGFSTNHHTNNDIIRKYRQVPWTFSIYRGIHLEEIYIMTPAMLEQMYEHWERKLETKSHLNNPKIPVKFVINNGIKVYPIDSSRPFNPDSINL